MEKPSHLKTLFTPYRLRGDSQEYFHLVRDRLADGVELLRVLDSFLTPGCGPAREVVLQTEYIFGDQWNSEPDVYSPIGYRLHNWYECIQSDITQRVGHFLSITDEMREVVRLTHKCGYCAAQYYGMEWADKFCDKCLSSPYLKDTDLFLLRLRQCRLSRERASCPPLTPDETAMLLPQYIVAQTKRRDSENAEFRLQLEEAYQTGLTKCRQRRDGFLWLLDHKLAVDNVIYYEHTDTFCFGWLRAFDKGLRVEWIKLLKDFPFKYEFASPNKYG